MSEAASEIIRFAFCDLNLRRLEAKAFVENVASNKLLQKLGFAFEGMHKQAVRSKATNKIHDANNYGLLREEWDELQED